MFTDSVNMMYFSPVKKLIIIQELIQDTFGKTWISKKNLAVILGKIASRLRSHGNVCQIMTRHCQHILGLAVHNIVTNEQDWNGCVFLDDHAKLELEFFFNNVI